MRDKKIERNKYESLKDKTIYKLIAMYDGICQRCGVLTDMEDYTNISAPPHSKGLMRRLGPTYPTVEHIIPRCVLKLSNIQAGMENLTLYCHKCNGIKSRLDAEARRLLDQAGM